jgi:[acyl-carrier-protein] S-malonyltransferase
MSFAFVFPGQGSQKVGMMLAYLADPVVGGVVRATFDEASEALGQDLWHMVAEGPAEVLSQTVNTQPVMLTAGIAAWRLWLEKGGCLPAVVAGHSLGEYSALVAAGVINFKDAVPLVRLRAAAMQEAVPLGAGAMAAILALDVAAIREACADSAQGEVVEPVNFNDPSQTVIAGHKGAVERAMEACKAKGAKRALALPVSAPFHSSLIRPAADKLATRLAELTFNAPTIPVINNVDVTIETDPSKIKDALIRQAYNPVRWVETMQKMASMEIVQVAECGPGKVLAGLAKRCVETLSGIALADLAAIEANLTLE